MGLGLGFRIKDYAGLYRDLEPQYMKSQAQKRTESTKEIGFIQ